MSRGFFGGGGGGDGNRGDLTKKKSKTNAMDFSRKRKKTMNEMIRDRTEVRIKSYDEMLEDLLDEKMTSSSRGNNYFGLPGTVPPEERQQSKGREAAVELYKMKMLKKRAKVRDMKVEIIPKAYGGVAGGWIDKKGKIRNKNGLVVMEVNLSNGVITDRLGMKVGKYNGQSMSNDFKIQRLIDKYTAAQGVFNPFASKDDTRFNPFGPKE